MNLLARGGACIVLLTLIIAAAASAASAKTLSDPTGRVVTPFDSSQISESQSIKDLVIEPSGAIVAAGASGRGNAVTLVRYTPSGKLDPTFGRFGVATSIGSDFTTVHALLRRPDGRFVTLASTGLGGQSLLVAMTAKGAPDASFAGGVVSLPSFLPGCDCGHGVALEAAGGVLVAGAKSGDGGGEILRVAPDGHLDAGFGNAGAVTVPGVLSFDALALDPGGDIFALAILSDRVHIAVVRLSPAGALRTGYGAAGFALLPENTAGDLLAIGSGQVLVSTAATSQQTGSTPALRRLRADGSVDPAYGGSGTVHPAGTRLVRAASGGVDVLSEFGDGGNRVTRLGIDGAVIRPTVTLRQGFGGGAFGAPARSPATVTFRPARAAGLGSFDVNAAVARPDGGLLLGGDAEVAVDDGGAGFVDSGSWGLESLRPDLSPDPGFGSRSGVSASLRLRHGSPRAAARRGSGVPISTGMTQRGEIEVRITARRGGRTITVANRTVVFLAATSARPLRIPVTLAGRRLLQRSGSVRVTVRGLATIVGGESRTLPRRSLTLR